MGTNKKHQSRLGDLNLFDMKLQIIDYGDWKTSYGQYTSHSQWSTTTSDIEALEREWGRFASHDVISSIACKGKYKDFPYNAFSITQLDSQRIG